MLLFLSCFRSNVLYTLLFAFMSLTRAHLFFLQFIAVVIFDEEHGWITSMKSPSFCIKAFIAGLINYPDNYRLHLTRWAILIFELSIPLCACITLSWKWYFAWWWAQRVAALVKKIWETKCCVEIFCTDCK